LRRENFFAKPCSPESYAEGFQEAAGPQFFITGSTKPFIIFCFLISFSLVDEADLFNLSSAGKVSHFWPVIANCARSFSDFDFCHWMVGLGLLFTREVGLANAHAHNPTLN